MERPTVPDKLKKFIRAVLLSKEGGVPVKQLCRDYRNLLGDELEWRGLGFTTLGDFVKAMPDVCRLEAFGPEKELRLYGIGDPDSYMSGAAIKAQKVKGPPKSATRQQRRQGQRSSPNKYGTAKSCWDGRSHDSGENPYGLQPVCGLYSVCMERRLDCTDQDIKRFFSAAGCVQQVHHTDRYTFVRFNTAREATAALDKLPSVLMGRSVRIQPASTRKRDSSASLESGRRQLTGARSTLSDKRSPTVSIAERPTSPFPVHELIVSQLTRDTTEEEVWNLFAPFGASNVRVRKEGPMEYGHAFVHFDSSESVDRARVALNNSVLNGQKIVVNLTKRAGEHRFAAEHCRGAQLQHSRPTAVPSVSSNPDKQGHPAGPSTTSGTGLSTASHLKASSSTEYSTVQVQVQQHKNLCPTPKFMSYSTMAQMMCECSDDQGEPVAPTPAASYPEELNVIVTEVVDGCHLWGQVNLEGKNNLLELQELQKGLNQLCPAPPLPPGEKTGAAPFEGEWYRVWVQEELPEDQLQLMFVDYGNTAVLPRTEVSPLLIPALWDLPPQAIPFKLAGLTPSTSSGPEKLKELVSWQVVSMKQSQCGTCEPHILEVEVFVPGISDSVNKLMKKETSGEDPPLTEKPFEGSESKLQSNVNKVVPVTASKASDHSIPGQKMATKEKETKGDIFSDNKTESQDTKHCLEPKETDRKFSHRIFNQRSEEKDYQKLESPFLSKHEEAAFNNLIGNNQQSGKLVHTDVGRQKPGNRVGEGCNSGAVIHKVPSLSTQSSRGAPFPGLTLLKDMAAQWQQGVMGGQQATVQHPKGLLGTPVTEYSPQLQYKGQTFGLDVKVTEVVTPELFYIQAADCTLLDIVSQGLQEAANKRTAQDLEDMKTLCHDTGQVMCSYSEKHHMWRRVRTVIVQPNMVTVHHVDYGTTDCTQLHNLFPLPHSLLSVPMLARPGCLANTAPLPNDHGDWTEGADAFLKGLTAGKVLYAEVCEQSGSKLVVSLWDSREKKLNLSQQLIGQNYAIHSRSLVPQPPSYPIVQQQNKPFLAMCQPPQISNQPFFVQDQKLHFPIPQYPVSHHLPQQRPAPRRRITLGERFTQLGNQRTGVPVLGGGGAFKMMERADEGNDRFTSRGDRSEPPVGQLHGERKYVKKDPRDQETCYRPTAQNMSGNKGEPGSATTLPTKLASSKEVHTSRKQFEPKNSTWATHRGNRGGKKIGRCVSPLSPEAQRNILKQIVGDMEKTSDTSQAGSDCGPARERRSTGDSEVSMELASRLEQLIQTDTEDGRESSGGCTPNSKSPTAKQHQKDPLTVDFQTGLPNACGKSAVDILTSQLIELHTEE